MIPYHDKIVRSSYVQSIEERCIFDVGSGTIKVKKIFIKK